MTFKEIKDLIASIGDSNLTEFKLEKKDFKLSIKTDKQSKTISQIVSHAPAILPAAAPAIAAPAAAPAPAQDNATSAAPAETTSADTSKLLEIKSPIVGTFYRSPSPDKDAFVKVGDTVEVGSVVCIVEAMKLFNEIESEVSGKIAKVMLDDSSPVEYDQVLFLVDPS